MFALPGQTKESLIEDLTTALQFHPTHLSYYQLTIEEGTAFYKREPSGLPDLDQAYAMLEEIESATAKLGFDHYEVSAYAKPGFRCKHNLNYWQSEIMSVSVPVLTGKLPRMERFSERLP